MTKPETADSSFRTNDKAIKKEILKLSSPYFLHPTTKTAIDPRNSGGIPNGTDDTSTDVDGHQQSPTDVVIRAKQHYVDFRKNRIKDMKAKNRQQMNRDYLKLVQHWKNRGKNDASYDSTINRKDTKNDHPSGEIEQKLVYDKPNLPQNQNAESQTPQCPNPTVRKPRKTKKSNTIESFQNNYFTQIGIKPLLSSPLDHLLWTPHIKYKPKDSVIFLPKALEIPKAKNWYPIKGNYRADDDDLHKDAKFLPYFGDKEEHVNISFKLYQLRSDVEDDDDSESYLNYVKSYDKSIEDDSDDKRNNSRHSGPSNRNRRKNTQLRNRHLSSPQKAEKRALKDRSRGRVNGSLHRPNKPTSSKNKPNPVEENCRQPDLEYKNESLQSKIERSGSVAAIICAMYYYQTGEMSADQIAQLLGEPFNRVKQKYDEFLNRYGLFVNNQRDKTFIEETNIAMSQVLSSYFNENSQDIMNSDSFKLLFCRRCFTYDCNLHLIAQKPPVVTPMDQSIYDPKNNLRETNCLTCSDLKTNPVTTEHGVPQDKLITESQAMKTLSVAPWTQFEKEALSGLLSRFGLAWCQIAKLIGSRSCIECRQYVQDNQINTDIYKSPFRDLLKVFSSRKKKLRINRDMKAFESNAFYEPCNHPGYKCTPEICSCLQNKSFCEKHCGCYLERPRLLPAKDYVKVDPCKNMFLGCRCQKNCIGSSCPCYFAVRECDPDICACNACKTGYGSDEAGYSGSGVSCENMILQKKLSQKTIIGASDIHGWGLYARTTIKKGTCIGEYSGEVLSQNEAEKRGQIYDRQNVSFLYTIGDYCVDATYKGTKLKFANHSQFPNCVSRPVRVNGDSRIGLYALVDLYPGDELFFDYNYDRPGADVPDWHKLAAKLQKDDRKRKKAESS